jgi:thiol-disulfide isomerase/thioredoxin
VQWLTDTSFDAFCAKHETVVADIFFPWCGKCKQEKKHFAKLAKKLAKNKQLKFAMIDAREHRLLARKFDVKCEDPCRLLVFKHDEPLTHIDAKLSSSALQTELKPYLGPLIKPLQPKQATVEFAKEHDSVAAIALLQKDSPAHIAFVALARSLRSSLVFGAVFADSDASFSTSAPALKVFNPANGKAGVGEFRGEWSDETLRAFIETEREPLLQEYSYDLRSKAEKKARAVGVLFVRRTESSKRKDRTAEQKKLDAAQNVHEATVRNVSAAHRGRMTFLWAAEAEFGHILEEFGLPRTTLPAFVVYHYGRILDHGRGASKYAYHLMHPDATTDTTVGGAAAAKLDVFVRSVLTDVKADRAPRAFKSETVPDQPAAQPSWRGRS